MITAHKEICKILLVDDHRMFLDGLEMILQQEPTLHIAATTTDPRTVLSLIATHAPDVVVTDLNMPEIDGLELVKMIKTYHPEIKILVLSMLNDRETVSNIMMVEAEGYILKNSDKVDLIKAIHTVYQGDTYYSNEILGIMLNQFQQKVKHEEAKQLLTQRELEILQLIAEELTTERIADKLFISPRTVETHRKNIIAKTRCSTLMGLLKYSVKHGLVTIR